MWAGDTGPGAGDHGACVTCPHGLGPHRELRGGLGDSRGEVLRPLEVGEGREDRAQGEVR
eukprot:5336027-Pyramimonas_sp.AAC.1